MKTVSMARDADDSGLSDYTPSTYPGGLTIYLDDDQCEKLGITKGMKAGTQVSLQAIAVVTSSTESLDRDADGGGNDINLSLQITDLGISAQGALKNAASALYG